MAYHCSPKGTLLGDELFKLSQGDVSSLYGRTVWDGLAGDVIGHDRDVW